VGGKGQARAARLNLQQLALRLRVVAAAGRMVLLLLQLLLRMLLRGLLHVAGGAGCGRGLEFSADFAVLGAASRYKAKGKSLGGVQITKYTLDMLSSFQKL